MKGEDVLSSPLTIMLVLLSLDSVHSHPAASRIQRNLPRTKKPAPGRFFASLRSVVLFDSRSGNKKRQTHKSVSVFFGDPYGNRTHVTAVKGRCLNRLTNGPGSGDLTRTGDRPGMNRVLYQLSYAAIGPASFGIAEISFVIISLTFQFVKGFIRIFVK